MEAQTESNDVEQIETVDISNDDLIEVLAQTAEYHRTRGATSDARLAVVGDGTHRMLVPTATNNVVEDEIVYAHELVADGELKDSIIIGQHNPELQVL